MLKTPYEPYIIKATFMSKQNVLIAIIFLSVGIPAGILLQKYYIHTPRENSITREGGYMFINPLLSCDISENKQFSEYAPIRDKFKNYIDNQVWSGNASKISVYFRSLNSGHWAGYNENDTYSPASLLKLPIMIAYLKEADIDPKILNEQMTYNQTIDGNTVENFKPKNFIENGKTYTVASLLQYMIVNSDNNAAQILQDRVDKKSLTEVYSDLGLPISSELSEDTMTPKNYSYIFRILYNATYLSKSLSQNALKLLSLTDFSGGIVAGTPKEIPMAHKFGERTILNKDTTTGNISLASRELHDCGIVYYPENPYLLCVMTKGKDFNKLSQIIKDISSMVYKESDSGVLKI